MSRGKPFHSIALISVSLPAIFCKDNTFGKRFNNR